MNTERLHLSDSYVRRFTATVIEAGEIDGKPAVQLDRTAFYATGGGQPNDRGRLGGADVTDVVNQDGFVWHVLSSPLQIGTTVEGEIDWQRRFDHMQQHTGQHLLSGCFQSVCGAATVGFHLGEQASTIDVDQPTLDPETAAAVEQAAAELVFADRPVDVHLGPDASQFRSRLRKETEYGDDVRVIAIADFDYSACGGTHCGSTAQIGPIKILRWERRGSNTRVEFVCGFRAVRDYGTKHATVKRLSDRMSVRDTDLADAVERLIADQRDTRRELDAAREQLSVHEAADLFASADGAGENGAARVVARIVEPRPPDALKRLAQQIIALGTVVVLLASEQPGRTSLVFAQTPGLKSDMAALLREAVVSLGGKGGGQRDLAQGGAPAGGNVQEVVSRAARSARESLNASQA